LNRPWREFYREMSPHEKRGYWLAMTGVATFFVVTIMLV